MKILSFYEAFAAAYATLLFATMLLAKSAKMELARSTGLAISFGLLALSLIYAILRAMGASSARERTSEQLVTSTPDAPKFQDPLREKRLRESVIGWIEDPAAVHELERRELPSEKNLDESVVHWISVEP